MAIKKIKKMYYSIGDVSDITQLKQYVLRYWETEFSFLNPKKNSAGNRTYTDKDIKVIKEIQSLLYEEKFTIKGANQYLLNKYSKEDELTNIVKLVKENSSSDKQLLLNLRKGLQDIVDLIDSTRK